MTAPPIRHAFGLAPKCSVPVSLNEYMLCLSPQRCQNQIALDSRCRAKGSKTYARALRISRLKHWRFGNRVRDRKGGRPRRRPLPGMAERAYRGAPTERAMTTLGTRLLTWLRGELVGGDSYGNHYYRLKGDKPSRRGGGRFSRERRWVIYNGRRRRARKCRRNGTPGCITLSTCCPRARAALSRGKSRISRT